MPNFSLFQLITVRNTTFYIIACAVCELVYLGSVEVSGPGSESVVRETVEQLKTLGLSTMNIVTFKASMSGITLTDDING